MRGLAIALPSCALAAVFTEPLYGISTGTSYTIAMRLGANASSTPFQMLLDTGSSNAAVATTTCCSRTRELLGMSMYSCAASPSCVDSAARKVSVNYIASSWSGHVVTDTVILDTLGAIPQVSFVTIDNQTQFFRGGFDGILGVAFDALAQPKGDPVTTLFQTLVNRQNIDDIFSILSCGILQPYVQGIMPAVISGTMILGGIVPSSGIALHRGPLIYSPLIQAKWYVVLVTDIGFNSTSLALDCKVYNTPRAIVDTGTTNLVLPTEVYRAVMAQIQEATLEAIPAFESAYFSDRAVCCDAICDPTNNQSPLLTLPTISISLALEGNTKQQVTVTIPPTYYWRPIVVHSSVGTSTCRMMGISEGTTLILGNVFMDGLMVVHDRKGSRVGVAVADNCPNRAISSKTVSTSQTSLSWCDCLSSGQLNDNLVTALFPGQNICFIWYWWTYVIIVAVSIIAVSCVALVWLWITRRRKKQRQATRAPPTLQESLLYVDEGPMTPKEAPPASDEGEMRPPSPAREFAF
ncbi:hypothetical protein AC1031_021122 [Aphanomyces cochlioides]|nr:hypothetical protein AC1031_021122 [Aphanomyces cochlioides]